MKTIYFEKKKTYCSHSLCAWTKSPCMCSRATESGKAVAGEVFGICFEHSSHLGQVMLNMDKANKLFFLRRHIRPKNC
jgi:hypothetical protein